MSTILRYGKHLRRLNGVGWRVLLNQPQIEVTGVKLGFYQTHLADLNLTKSYATNVAAKQSYPLYHDKETGIQMLESRAKRQGRVSKPEIQKVLMDMQYSGRMSSLEALFLIRCCGRLFFESSNEESIELVQEVWDTCERLNVPIDVSHYNALLNVYLEKDHKFAPSSFISAMLEKSIEPNRVTYQRLIAAYCKQGDIAGATKILEIMKEKNMPLCEDIFNSLIVGHSQAGDLESATKILETMKNAGITPSSDTYEALMCAHAKCGDMQFVDTTIEQMKKSEESPLSSQLLEVFYTFAANGHVNEAEKFAEKHLSAIGTDVEVGRILVKLVNMQQVPLAMKLLAITTFDQPRKIARSAYIIRAANRSEHFTEDDLVQICKDLETNGLSDRAFQTAIFHCFKSDCKPATIISLFKAWREHGGEIRTHYFWPLLRSYTKQNSYEGMLKVISTMINEFNLIPCVETLQDYVIPYMFGTWQDAITVLKELKVPQENICFAILNRLFVEKKMRNAGMFMTAFPMKYPKEMFLKPLVEALLARNHPETFVDALRLLDQDPNANTDDGTPKELVDAAVMQLISILPPYRNDVLLSIFAHFAKYGMSMSPEVGKEVRLFLDDKVNPEVDELIKKLTSGTATAAPVSESNPYKHIAKLEQHATSDSRELRLKFADCLRTGDTNGILNILRSMEASNYFSPAVYAQALSYFCDSENLEAAKKCMETSKKLDVKFDNSKKLKYAILLVKNNLIEDAINFISELPEAEGSVKLSRTLRFSLRGLFDLLAKAKDDKSLSKVFNILYKKNYINPDTFMLGPMVQVHLEKGDIESALVTFERIFDEYKCLPLKTTLTKRFIEMEDANSLQKITDLATEIHGEANALTDLAFVFLECNRLRQAQKILETSGMQIRNDRVTAIIERLRNLDQLEILGQLPKLMRGVTRMDHGYMFNSLLEIYDEKNNWEKGLELWTELQETDSQPTPEFLSKLHKLLERNGQKIPFVHSAIDPTQNLDRTIANFSASSTNVSKQKEPSSRFREALLRQDYNLAEDLIMTEATSMSEKLGMYYDTIRSATDDHNFDKAFDLTKKVLKQYSRMNRAVLTNLTEKINSEAGLKQFESLGELMDGQLKERIRYQKLHSILHVRIHGLKHYLENLDLTPPSSFPRAIESRIHFGAIVEGLCADPTALPLVKEIATKLLEQGVDRPLHALWNYHFIMGSPEAEHLWDEHVSKSSSPLIQPIADVAKKNQDPQLVHRLVELIERQEHMSLNVKAKLATTLITVYNASGRYEEALKVFQEASGRLRGKMLSMKELKNLKAGLEKSGEKSRVLQKAIDEKRKGTTSEADELQS